MLSCERGAVNPFDKTPPKKPAMSFLHFVIFSNLFEQQCSVVITRSTIFRSSSVSPPYCLLSCCFIFPLFNGLLCVRPLCNTLLLFRSNEEAAGDPRNWDLSPLKKLPLNFQQCSACASSIIISLSIHKSFPGLIEQHTRNNYFLYNISHSNASFSFSTMEHNKGHSLSETCQVWTWWRQ